MFTGLIAQKGRLVQRQETPQGVSFELSHDFGPLTRGESIAVNGVCLTVTSSDQGTFSCEVSPETLSKTTLGHWGLNRRVHLERALRVGDRLGGHWVQGHVDGTAQLLEKVTEDRWTRLRFETHGKGAADFLLPQGSVAVDGVSLTLTETDRNLFSVMIIPETALKTELVNLVVGDQVNIEFDWMTKAIVHTVRQM